MLDQLAPAQFAAVVQLLETLLSSLERKIALAPIDDEPMTPEEAAAIQVCADSIDKDGGVPMKEALADFGLTMDDLQNVAEPKP